MSETTPTIYQLIPAVMREIGAVGKNGRNEQQRYRFRGIDDVMNGIDAALIKHGVFYTPEVLQSEHTYRGEKATHVFMRVRFTFYGPAGDSVATVTEGEAMDYSDKASNKAMSAALKYALVQTLNIPTENVLDEADLTTPTPETREHSAAPSLAPTNSDGLSPQEIADQAVAAAEAGDHHRLAQLTIGAQQVWRQRITYQGVEGTLKALLDRLARGAAA